MVLRSTSSCCVISPLNVVICASASAVSARSCCNSSPLASRAARIGRALSRQMTNPSELSANLRRARSDPAARHQINKKSAFICNVVCVLGLSILPAVWCLAIYGSSSNLPCDRPIGTCLLWIGVTGAINAVGATINTAVRNYFCPPPSLAETLDGAEDNPAGKSFEGLMKCLLFPVQISSFCWWVWLSGICWWMYPYEQAIVDQLASGDLVPGMGNNSVSIDFWPGEVPWAIQNAPNLLNYNIEGCHPDLLFGARGYLTFTYVMLGVACCCIPVALCACAAAAAASGEE